MGGEYQRQQPLKTLDDLHIWGRSGGSSTREGKVGLVYMNTPSPSSGTRREPPMPQSWHLGNDVVDRADPRCQGKSRDRRFLDRVFSREEQDAILAAPDQEPAGRRPGSVRWTRWSAHPCVRFRGRSGSRRQGRAARRQQSRGSWLKQCKNGRPRTSFWQSFALVGEPWQPRRIVPGPVDAWPGRKYHCSW